MAERQFTDSKGTSWRVRVMVTGTPKVGPLHVPKSTQFRPVNMSLAFESERERRRLAPVPHGWELAPDAELERMLERSLTITIRVNGGR